MYTLHNVHNEKNIVKGMGLLCGMGAPEKKTSWCYITDTEDSEQL